MARTESQWQERGGTYLEPSNPSGLDILIKGTNKYINFATIVGSSGYGFRDNAGVMEYKDDSGNWSAFSNFLTVTDLPTSLLIYPTTASSPVSGYYRLVTDMSDPDYDEPAVDVPTGAISGTDQLIASLASDQGIVIGDLGIFNVTVIGNIRKTAGATSTDATFHFEVYKRESGGTETLIATSDETLTVTSSIYVEFSATALFNDGTFTSTDRIVLKFYGTKVGGGVAPEYDFQFGGSLPVRIAFPVPTSTLLSGYVPYTGATADVDLGLHDLAAQKVSVANSATITVPNVTAVSATQVSGTFLTYIPGTSYTYNYNYYYFEGTNRYHFAVVAYKIFDGQKIFSTTPYEFYVDVASTPSPVDIDISITPVTGADGYWLFYGGSTTNDETSVSFPGSQGEQYTSTSFLLSDYPTGVNFSQMTLFSGETLPEVALQVSGKVQFDDVLKWTYGSNSLLYTNTTNFLFGENSGDGLTTGLYNTTYGKNSGTVLTNSSTNTLIGYEAGKILYASGNTIVGALSGKLITTGPQNTALGASSLTSCTTGNRNITIGFSALTDVTTGFGNLGIGAYAGQYVTTQNNHWNIGTQVTSYDWNSSNGLLNFNNFMYAEGITIATGNPNSRPVPTLSLGFGVLPHAQTDNYFRGGAMFGSKTGLGSEKIQNSDCSSTTGWTLGSGWGSASGVFAFSGATAGTLVQTSANMLTPLVVGKMYYLSITGGFNPNIANGDVTSRIGVNITIGGVNLGNLTSVGEYIFVATSTADLVITPTANNTVKIDTISLKEVTQGDIVTGGNIQALGNFKSSDGSTGFTGTGAYTNFTIKNGIITNAT